MAYLKPDDQDPDASQTVGAAKTATDDTLATGGGSGSVGDAGAAGGAPAAAAPQSSGRDNATSAPTGTGFVNLSQYLDANRGFGQSQAAAIDAQQKPLAATLNTDVNGYSSQASRHVQSAKDWGGGDLDGVTNIHGPDFFATRPKDAPAAPPPVATVGDGSQYTQGLKSAVDQNNAFVPSPDANGVDQAVWAQGGAPRQQAYQQQYGGLQSMLDTAQKQVPNTNAAIGQRNAQTQEQHSAEARQARYDQQRYDQGQTIRHAQAVKQAHDQDVMNASMDTHGVDYAENADTVRRRMQLKNSPSGIPGAPNPPSWSRNRF